MKRTIGCMILAICLMAAGFNSLAEGVVFSKPGIYSASAAGRNGDVTVTATFSDTAITDIEAVHAETPTIGDSAIQQLTDQVLSSQTLALDAVSGATLTSNAFMQALENCVEQAGGDADAMKKASADQTEAENAYEVTDADLIVVGAGGAGLTAAKVAGDQGLSVILLEKSGVVGGNSLCSQMGINAAGAKIQEGLPYATRELLTEAQSQAGGRENLISAYVENSGKAIDWFVDELGIDFEGPNSERVDPSNPIASALGGHPSGGDLFMMQAKADGYTSNTLVNALSKSIRNSSNITLYVNTEATELVIGEAGNVVGVKAKAKDGSEVTFTGKAVLLATGGFGQNHEMVAALRPDLKNAITDEMAPTTGDGIVMAEAIGAKTVDMDAMQIFPHVPVGDTWMGPFGMPGGFRTSAIFVNQDAQRFTTEGFDNAANDILAQEKTFSIFSAEDMNPTLEQLKARGIVKMADTPQELAEQLGLDPEALAATIAQYNADCEAGKDSQFNHENLKKLEGALGGYAFGVGAHYMMGGLLINEKTQVLNESEQPIEGLYAAGEVTGGFHGTVRVDGSGTGDAFVFGYVAGNEIVSAIK